MTCKISPVHQQDVRITVVVVVEKRAAWAHRLWKPFLAERAVVMGKTQPGRSCDIAKCYRLGGRRPAKTMHHRTINAEAILEGTFLSMQSLSLKDSAAQLRKQIPLNCCPRVVVTVPVACRFCASRMSIAP